MNQEMGVGLRMLTPALVAQLQVDWTTTIHLQDSTSFEDSDYLPTDFSIVFFQGNFEEWLPQASEGDILILHGIRVSTTFPSLHSISDP